MAAQGQQPRPPLRRAVYVHVSDLTSAYNIDHARLEEELKRVKADRENTVGLKPRSGSNEMETSGTQKRLQPPRGGYNLCLLVGSVHVVVDKFRVDGSRVRLAEVEVGDETGTVSLRARDEQIDLLTEISERKGAVVLRNSTLELYQGRHIRLAVTKWGKLTAYPDQVPSTPAPPSRMNNDRYFSLIDLSAVASEMVVYTQNDPYPSNRPNEYENPSHPSGGTQQQQRGGRGSGGNRRSNTAGGGRGKSSASSGGHPQQVMKQQVFQQQQQQPVVPEAPSGLQLGYPSYGGYTPQQVDTQPQAMYAYHAMRQQQRPPQDPQQIMYQQQYQPQMHQQQMHYQPATPPGRAPQLASGGPGPMLLSGMGGGAFDARFATGQEMGVPQGQQQQQQRAFYNVPASPSSQSIHQQQTGLEGGLGAESPRMNPQAPTFDPSYRTTGRRQQHPGQHPPQNRQGRGGGNG